MKRFHGGVSITVLLLVLMSWPTASVAQSSGLGMELLQKAVESSDVRVDVNEDGEVVSVVAKPCPSCTGERFLPADSIAFKQGERSLTAREASALSGAGGTIIYNSETEMADKVIFFAR